MFGLIPYRRNLGLGKRDSLWDIDSFIESFFNDSFVPAFFAPVNPMRADIRETDKEYIIDVEIPGVKKEDIKIDIKDDILNVSVEKNEEIREERKDFIRRERRYGSCSRSFNISGTKQDKIKAKYADGILTITLPKAEEAKENRRTIDIE